MASTSAQAAEGDAAEVLPDTVSADALPTPQVVNGVVRDQVVVGSTVYVVGEFTTVRPAGSDSTVTRTNALAYDIATGDLLDWAPQTNGAIQSIAAMPDGSRLFIGGAFSQVNGETVWRVAAIDPVTAERKPLTAAANAKVFAVEVSADGSTLYVGGAFTQVNNQERLRFAAVDLTTKKLLDLKANIPDFSVRTIAAEPNGTGVAIGGSFTSVNGSTNPGYGMAILEQDGSVRQNNLTSVVKSGNTYGGIMDLKADEQGLYGAAYTQSRAQGNLEGVFRADWTTGDVDYIADCHGDSYDVFPSGDVVYAANHGHDCSNIGGFPNNTANYHYALAYANYATGTVGTNTASGYFDFGGQPGTTNLNWYPDFTPGTYTGLGQATWTVEGNDEYIVFGGEFTAVNGESQQGLTRFARRDIAPNQQGPVNKGGSYQVTVSSPTAGVVRLSFSANWDRDDKTLSYAVYRDSLDSEPIWTHDVTAGFWELPTLTVTDSVDPGSTHQYVVRVTDPYGAATRSDWVTVTAASGDGVALYGQQVTLDGATNYWPLDEDTRSTTAADIIGGTDLTYRGSRYTTGVQGVWDGGAAASFSSTSRFRSWAAQTAASAAPSTFSVEAWFRTSSSSGGEIVGFSSRNDRDGQNKDRMIYLSNNGTISYMLYPGSTRVVSSAAGYNDNAWHHVVATTDGASGTVLYVDGEAVAADAAMTSGQSYNGYWRIGGDTNSGLPNAGSSGYLAGAIDEVAVYGKVLSAQQVASHHTLGTTGELPEQDPAEQGEMADGVLISDSFTRETTRGWGTTDSGAVWTANYGVSRMSVDGSVGLMTMTGAGTANSVSSPVVDSTSTDSTVDFVLDQMPTGAAAYVTYVARANSAGRYQVQFDIAPTGSVLMTLSKRVGATQTALGTARVSGNYSAGQVLHMRFVADGADSTDLRIKAWIGEVEEPQDWGIEVTDEEAALADPGSVGIITFTSGKADSSELTLRVDNLLVKIA
nr:LamG domain-containing protein [Actinomyces glycerinitolerans]